MGTKSIQTPRGRGREREGAGGRDTHTYAYTHTHTHTQHRHTPVIRQIDRQTKRDGDREIYISINVSKRNTKFNYA